MTPWISGIQRAPRASVVVAAVWGSVCGEPMGAPADSGQCPGFLCDLPGAGTDGSLCPGAGPSVAGALDLRHLHVPARRAGAPLLQHAGAVLLRLEAGEPARRTV